MSDALIDIFGDYFEILPAEDQSLKEEIYRLRFEVYCREKSIKGFDPANYPDEMESDEYDRRSVQSLLRHRRSGVAAGTVRIILPDRDDPQALLPLERYCIQGFYREFVEQLPSREHLGEISRLILAPRFRSRHGEFEQPHGVVEPISLWPYEDDRRKPRSEELALGRRTGADRRLSPHPILGLFAAVVRMSVQQKLQYWYAGMEPSCARFLKRFGFDFIPITPLIDYYGPCRGYFGEVVSILSCIYHRHPSVWDLFTDEGKFLPMSETPQAIEELSTCHPDLRNRER